MGDSRRKVVAVQFLKRFGVFVALMALLLAGVTTQTATASQRPTGFTAEQQTLFSQYGLSSQQIDCLVVDSKMSYDQAIGDSVVPADVQDIHAKMKPLLRVLPEVYHGYDGRIHLGQIVVHEYVVGKVNRLFLKMFALGFPIYSVIPESHFGYDDQRSMAANNSSAYRPERDSVHVAGAAIDLNTFTNPFDVTAYDPNRPIQPPGAHYNPAAKGAIVKSGPVRVAWTAEHFEWGGGWGDPAATPPTDYFRTGFFDYQHFQPDFSWYDEFYKHVPAGV